MRGGSRALCNLRKDDAKRLVQAGRAFPKREFGSSSGSGSSSSSGSIDLEAGEADALVAKRPCLGHSLHRKFDGGLRDITIAERDYRRKATPQLKLTPELQEVLEKATAEGARPLATPSAATPSVAALSKPAPGAAKSSKSAKKLGKDQGAPTGGRAKSSKDK